MRDAVVVVDEAPTPAAVDLAPAKAQEADDAPDTTMEDVAQVQERQLKAAAMEQVRKLAVPRPKVARKIAEQAALQKLPHYPAAVAGLTKNWSVRLVREGPAG